MILSTVWPASLATAGPSSTSWTRRRPSPPRSTSLPSLTWIRVRPTRSAWRRAAAIWALSGNDFSNVRSEFAFTSEDFSTWSSNRSVHYKPVRFAVVFSSLWKWKTKKNVFRMEKIDLNYQWKGIFGWYNDHYAIKSFKLRLIFFVSFFWLQ